MHKAIYGIRFFKTFIKLGIRKCFGMLHMQYKFTNAVAKGATVRTINGGNISFGSVVQIRPNVEISANGGNIVLEGKNYVNRNTMIVSHEAITIGEGTTIGPNCCIYDHDHQLYPGGGINPSLL